jgi:hypothetical protein
MSRIRFLTVSDGNKMRGGEILGGHGELLCEERILPAGSGKAPRSTERAASPGGRFFLAR